MNNSNSQHVSVALDLSSFKKQLIRNALPNVYISGKEVELLEAVRRTNKKEEIDENLLDWHAYAIDITGPELALMKESFLESKMMEISPDSIELNYMTTDTIYKYGTYRINTICSEIEFLLLDYLSKTMDDPMPASELTECLSLLKPPFNQMMENFLVQNKIIAPFDYKNEHYFISPRIYKNEQQFRTAYEILEDNNLIGITRFLKDNPGNPSTVVARHLRTDARIIDALNQCGITDPLKLNVAGDPKTYLFSTDCTNDQPSKDYLDLVKMTLANFRYGEYYSKISKLDRLDNFLSSMIDRGYAGRATAIGTDYKNLEIAGILKVQPLSGGRYRFWMLKKDVIEGARSVLRGNIPIQSNLNVGSINDMENIVKTRSSINVNLENLSIDNIVSSLRSIQEELI